MDHNMYRKRLFLYISCRTCIENCLFLCTDQTCNYCARAASVDRWETLTSLRICEERRAHDCRDCQRNRTREKNHVGDQARHNIIGANPPLAHSRRMHRRPNARSIMDGHPAAARKVFWVNVRGDVIRVKVQFAFCILLDTIEHARSSTNESVQSLACSICGWANSNASHCADQTGRDWKPR